MKQKPKNKGIQKVKIEVKGLKIFEKRHQKKKKKKIPTKIPTYRKNKDQLAIFSLM